ncbi:unnamed protein product [Plutella xylostella]|uniref:(diamondback moth) hypothetical protein n=1 Tax=Plutella xylostella TaxID=51655 RepID=A0A8S4ESF5_PLUXY|nr:unnamed protein product [Plutella xylostella]
MVISAEEPITDFEYRPRIRKRSVGDLSAWFKDDDHKYLFFCKARLKFLEQKYWQSLLGFVLSLPLRSSGCERRRLELDALQVACFCAYCEYFIENGLTEVVHLTWLIANRTAMFVAHYADAKPLIDKLNENASASGLLVQAIAARGARVSGELALNTLSILSGCHESQSGPLVFLICRMLGQLEPAVAMRYESVGVARCTLLASLPADQVLMQLTREDVQIALETLQRDRGQMRAALHKVLVSKLLSRKTKIRIYKTVIRPILMYGSEAWTLTLKEENKLLVAERKVMRKMLGPTRREDGSWRVRKNQEMEDLISEPNIIGQIKSQRLRWLGHLQRMGEDRGARATAQDRDLWRLLVSEAKIHFGSLSQRSKGSRLISALTALQSAVWQASPVSSPRAVSTAYVRTAAVDAPWLATLVKNRCCQTNSATSPKVPKHHELALLLSNLSKEDLSTVMECQEFDRKLIASCFKVACDGYLKEFYDIISAYETREIDKEQVKQQREILKMKEEMNANVDSNKLNVANTLHVFKKSDNKESKSQFFIPISEDSDLKEKFGNLELTEEEIEVIPPAVPNLYLTAVTTLDKSLTDIIRLFPKQNRPLSQSENFDLSVEQSIDRYTKRCQQVFQDKLFYQEFITAQTMLTGLLESFTRLKAFFDDVDCDIYDKCKADVLPTSLAKNIALFSMVSLQYLSFLIKNKKLVETQVNTDASLLETDIVTEKVVVDNVICVTLDNVSKALGFKEIWTELNVPKYENRSQSAISCLYAVVKYFVKDTKPLTLKNYLQPEEKGPKSDIVLICDKLLTLIEYWEDTFYKKGLSVDNDIIGQSYRKPLESLLVSLARLDIAHHTALIPPPAWACVVPPSSEPARRVHLPLHALRDLDVLDAFLFRVHLIGWSSKKQFEEIWVALLAAFGGNGVHRAVAGVMQLLLGAVSGHLPRQPALYPMPQLRKILAGTSAYDAVFERVNLERIPLQKDCDGPLYHCAQFNTEFLMLASESIEDASFTARQQLKRMRKNQDIDINSCLQLLIDVATNMLEPKADTGLAARAALITCLTHVTHVLQSASLCALLASRLARASAHDAAHFPGVRARALAGLALCLTSTRHKQELTSVHQNLVKSLSSSSPLLRQAALQGCLLRLHQPQERALAASLVPYLHRDSRVSLYEQSLHWTVLFSLVELGHPELLNSAVDFVLKQPQHYCADLVVKGITSVIRQKVLPKELKNSIIEKLLDNMKKYSEHHAVQILMVHLFSADNKLLSPKLATDVSNMDPDVLMSSMERITLLYKVLREFKKPESIHIVTTAIKYFLRETLPPAATLSRVVIEFIESCKVSEKALLNGYEDRERWVMGSVANGDVVFEVFETAISQDQLPVLSGWIFEALCHLLSGKISSELLPYCVNLLLISASANPFIRKLAPLSLYTLRLGFYNSQKGELGGIFKDFVRIEDGGMSFVDRRLLCIVAMHSGFTPPQMERIKELCEGNDSLSDLHRCLTET